MLRWPNDQSHRQSPTYFFFCSPDGGRSHLARFVRGGSGAVSHQRGDAMRFDFARNITIDETDSFAVVRIRNPWDTLRTLHTYVLVADSLLGAVIIA